jgi:hypothetical protein
MYPFIFNTDVYIASTYIVLLKSKFDESKMREKKIDRSSPVKSNKNNNNNLCVNTTTYKILDNIDNK